MIHRDPHTDSIHVTLSSLEVAMNPKVVMDSVHRRVVDILAERFVRERGQEILASLDPQAIANLTIAEAAQVISERISWLGVGK